METVLWLKLLLILVLIMGNAYFVGAEVAITGARRSKIKQLADLGNKAAMRVQELHMEPERFYSVTQIGITLVSLALGAIGMDTLVEVMGPGITALFSFFGGSASVAHTVAYLIAFAIISFLHVVGGELAPKILAFHKAETLAMAVSWSVNAQYLVYKPVIWAMNHASNFLLWTWGQKELIGQHGEHFSMTEEEIRTIISASEGAGVLHASEAKMITGVIDLEEHTVREAMVPRTDILALPHLATLRDALSIFKNEPHARFPVFEENLDKIVGVVAMKELLTQLAESSDPAEEASRPVSEFMHPPYIVPNSKSLISLLTDFKVSRQQMAVVVDEYGGTEGIITLEDILEEIVGEYADEFTPQHRRIKKTDTDQFVIDASMRVTDLETIVNCPFPQDGDYITLAGLVYKHLGRIPNTGDAVEVSGGRLEVMEMEHHRITKIRFTHKKGKESENGSGAADSHGGH
ncbi:MAG: HlyC/CorC family transporter [Magnetococcales bacterium]|nr:HlyC/CorC family transporter [Magnetococcales bacterium]